MTIKIDFEGVRWIECSKVKEFVEDIMLRIFNRKEKFSSTPDTTKRIIKVCAEELLEEKLEITASTGNINSRTELSSEGIAQPLSKSDSALQGVSEVKHG